MDFDRAVFVADSHIGSRAENRNLLEFIETESSGVDAFFLVGDIFRLFIGYKKLRSELQKAFLNRIGEIRSKGTEIHYLEGNRDFFLKENYLENYFDSISEQISLNSGGARYRVSHGNLINPEENIYRLWNTVSKSKLSAAVTKALPADFTIKAADYIERKMSDPSGTTYSELPEGAVREYGSDMEKKGYDGLILGHFHKKKILEEGNLKIYCLPAWFENGVYLELTGGESPEFKSYNGEIK